MRRLKGDGSIKVGRGSIEGIDLDKLMGSFDVQGGTTVFDSLDATFNITDGVLRNTDLAMLLPNFTTTGAGQIDLGGQALDYTVTPKALRLNEGKGIAVPVRISGPWASPKIRPDLKAAIDLNLAEEKEKLEQEVKQKVEDRVAEELGITRQEGQSVEDAVKDKVEDAVKDRLKSLFD
jgi:AsmA protein